jgi:predicted ABC-type transport system involved in lysophospholipase L1 biosynthesis ATPase subunit
VSSSENDPKANDAAPLLALESARIEQGAFTTEPLTASGGTRLVALVGYFSPFFRLLRGEARLASGAVRLGGHDAREAVRSGSALVASQSAPPLALRVRQFLVASARLALLAEREAERRVGAALERLRLSAVAEHALADVPEGVRRRVSLARAALGSATLVIAEAPLAELDPTTYAEVASLLDEIAAEQRLIVSFPAEPEPDRGLALLERADFTLRFSLGPSLRN